MINSLLSSLCEYVRENIIYQRVTYIEMDCAEVASVFAILGLIFVRLKQYYRVKDL